MIRSLYLSTALAVETNTRLALKAATSALHQQQQPQSAATDDGIDIFLHVHDNSRSTFLLHAQHLYGAAVTASASLRLDVIPILSEVKLSRSRSSGDVESEEALYNMASAPLEEQEVREGPLRLYTRDVMEAAAAKEDGGFRPLYRYVAVGGTFDHLHCGHKLLLTTAALYASQKLRCGVTGDALLQKKKHAQLLQPIETRMAGAEHFVKKVRPDLELELDTISDVSGGTDTIPDVEALTVSPETEKSLPIINALREKNGGLKPLVGIPISFVMTPAGHIISSTELRQRLEEGRR